MAKTTATLEIKVNKSKCMDDLFELNQNISELCELIPDHLHYLAQKHTDKIGVILKSFVKVGNG
jgi:hypothetical protein